MFFDDISLGIFLHFLLYMPVQLSFETINRVFLCGYYGSIALIGAAVCTIGWIVASLNGDMKGLGPAMAITAHSCFMERFVFASLSCTC